MNEVTVAVCAYNCENFIHETLDCISKQTFQDFDLCIVNDHSTDNTRAMIQQFLERSRNQTRFFDFDENHGIAYGRKFILENVNTDYVLFIDADDRPYPEMIEKLFSKIKSDQNLVAVGCYHEYIDKKGLRIGGGLFLGPRNSEEFIQKAKNNKLIFMQPTAIINREVALKVGGIIIDGYPDSLPRYQDLCEDLDLWSRLSDLYVSGKSIIVLPEILCQYRKMESTTSTNTFGMILKMKYIKFNLLKRRNGQMESTFTDFYNSIPANQIKSYRKEAKAALLLREGVFALRKTHLFSALLKFIHSFLLNPSYFFQKVRNNYIR